MPNALSYTAAQAEYQEAAAEYRAFARIEDRLSDRERREKEAAGLRVDRAWCALQRAKP